MPELAKFLPPLLAAAVVTAKLTILAGALAVALATVAGLARLSRFRVVRVIAWVYVEVFRGTSSLVQLFWLFFVLPHFGVHLEPMTVGVLGLGLNVGAYGSEVVRGAIVAVPRPQYEAAIALNMSPYQTLRRVILPQAVVAMLPPWGNLLVDLLKASAVVSLITISELTFRAYQLNLLTLETTWIFSLVMAIYFAMALGITAVVRSLERRIARSRGMRVAT